ncbi:MAG: lipid A deacylase LpxR family protein [Spirochaetaceae bacterium]
MTRKLRLSVYLCVLLFFPASLLIAGENDQDTDISAPFSLGYRQENDGPWVNPVNGTDRYYTHGVAMSVTHQPEWGRELAELLPFGRNSTRSGVGYLFAHEMYTPENLSESEPIADDRPYAGYAYLGVAHYRAGPATLEHLRIDVGAVGPATQAEEIQTYAHENWGGREPRGWSNQLANRPTVQLSFERRWRLQAGGRFAVQLLPQLVAGLGTLRSEARLGSSLRLGFNLPVDFGPSRFGSPREATALPQPGLGIFGIAGAAGRAVGHDALFSGGESDTGPGRRVEHVVGELSVGGGAVLRVHSWSLEAHYAQVLVSPEFRGQEGRHRYGSAFFAIAGPHPE